MYKKIYLKKGKEESLKRFHPWVFSGAIQHLPEDVDEGEVVRVMTAGGEFIAVGHYQIGSIAVRVLSFDDVEIDDAFWYGKLQSALSIIPPTIPIALSMARETTSPDSSSMSMGPQPSCRRIASAFILSASALPPNSSR